MPTYLGWTVVTAPLNPSPASIEPTYRAATAVVVSPFSYQQQVQDWAGRTTDARITMPAMGATSGAAWVDFLVGLAGQANVFQFPPSWAGLIPSSVSASGYWRLKGQPTWSLSPGLVYGMTFEIMEAK